MGLYLNPGAEAFLEAVNSEIYVDKTGLIRYTNKVLKTQQKYVCVSRPRRFGKSIAANMICAYYDRTVDGKAVFQDLQIAASPENMERQGQYDVLRINMQEFLSRTHDIQTMLSRLNQAVLWDVLGEYPDFRYFDKDDMIRTLADIYSQTKRQFVIVIDEWDCIFREYPHDKAAQRQYLDFLRDWLKDKTYIALAYMTGILPIKKYGTHSALNMFTEFSMEQPGLLASYVGFTQDEVKSLCCKYGMDFEECRAWYDGYRFPQCEHIYNPKSVVDAMLNHSFGSYWNKTETYEALQRYIDLNEDGLRDAIIRMMSGGVQKIDTGTFQNDMTTFASADDVMTLLVHLGYLGYDRDKESVFIPNNEILQEYVNATKHGSEWEIISRSVKASDELLQAVFEGQEKAVAAGVEAAHLETSQIQYNDENALSYTLSLAFYSARRYYNVLREMPTGKGFADLVFLPRPQHIDKPALLVELKWNQDAETAIRQIHEKKYAGALKNYAENIILVGINYDKKTKKHECKIERYK